MFLIHPSHFKTVVWIPDRIDLLAVFFLLCSFIAYIIHRERRSRIIFCLSVFFFVCALFSKESAVVFPLIVMCYELYRYLVSSSKSGFLVHVLVRPALYIPLILLYPYFPMDWLEDILPPRQVFVAFTDDVLQSFRFFPIGIRVNGFF